MNIIITSKVKIKTTPYLGGYQATKILFYYRSEMVNTLEVFM